MEEYTQFSQFPLGEMWDISIYTGESKLLYSNTFSIVICKLTFSTETERQTEAKNTDRKKMKKRQRETQPRDMHRHKEFEKIILLVEKIYVAFMVDFLYSSFKRFYALE